MSWNSPPPVSAICMINKTFLDAEDLYIFPHSLFCPYVGSSLLFSLSSLEISARKICLFPQGHLEEIVLVLLIWNFKATFEIVSIGIL